MQHIELKVDGMTCSGCARRLQRVLEATDGVCAADGVLDTHTLPWKMTPTRSDPARFMSALPMPGSVSRRPETVFDRSLS